MPNLNLYAPLAVSTTSPVYHGDLGAVARNYRRTSRAVAGYYAASFEISQEDLTRRELLDLYATILGCRMVDQFCGTVAWEGQIEDVRMVYADGSSYVRSLRPQWFHNYVNVRYSDTVGSTAETGWSSNADSIAQYGRLMQLISMGGLTSTGAADLLARHLTEFAWPRSRRSGSAQIGGQPRGEIQRDSLEIVAAGYWHTLNWRYRESSTTDAASTLISTLVGESEFVTAGRIETNADSLRIDAYPIPQRLGDLVENVILQGDSTGALWQGGVYAGRLMRYEAAPTTYAHMIQAGMLVDLAGSEIPLPLVEPGFLLYDADAPVGGEPAGTANPLDDPRFHYVEEVEFVAGAPDILVLRLREEEDTTSTLEMRIRGGNV